MAINLDNFLNSQNMNSKMSDFQDLEHLDGLSISTATANLYNNSRDDVVMFYFRNGARTKYFASFITDGGANLYFNNSKKLGRFGVLIKQK